MPDCVIYVDMDGVLADFMEGLLWVHNRGDLIEAYEEGRFPNDWWMDGELGDEENIWKPVFKAGEYFWTNLNPYDWAGNVIKEVEATGLPWYICTTPAKANPECNSGKLRWLMKYLPDKCGQRIIMMKDKYLLAHPDALLIDDSDSNCEAFAENGGHAFLWPQSWNKARNQTKHRIPLLHSYLKEWTEVACV